MIFIGTSISEMGRILWRVKGREAFLCNVAIVAFSSTGGIAFDSSIALRKRSKCCWISSGRARIASIRI